MSDASNLEPITILVSESERQLELCDRLENLADRLPYDVERSELDDTITAHIKAHQNHVFLQEQLLFPVLRNYAVSSQLTREILDQAEREHSIDEDFSHEISDAVALSALRHGFENPELLGYMIRSQFETQRRHLAWERIVIFPLVRETLTVEDAGDLGRQMSRLLSR